MSSILLIIPQALIFGAITLLKHVTATRTFWGFVNDVLDTLDVLIGWGGVAAILTLIALIGAGFSAKARPIAASAVLIANLSSAGYLAVWMGVSRLSDAAFFFTPAVVSAVASVWVIRQDVFKSRLAAPRAVEEA